MGLIKLVAGAIGAASGAFNTTTQNAWVDYFESGDKDFKDGVLREIQTLSKESFTTIEGII